MPCECWSSCEFLSLGVNFLVLEFLCLVNFFPLGVNLLVLPSYGVINAYFV